MIKHHCVLDTSPHFILTRAPCGKGGAPLTPVLQFMNNTGPRGGRMCRIMPLKHNCQISQIKEQTETTERKKDKEEIRGLEKAIRSGVW